LGLQAVYNFTLAAVFPLAHVDCMKRFAQIAAVAGALSMLVGFVVYSQQEAVQPDGHFKIAPAETSTNPADGAAPAPTVAPGFKSKAPLVSPPPPVAATNGFRVSQMLPVGTEISVRAIVASSSKSAILIKAEDLNPGVPQVTVQRAATFTNPFAHYFAPPGQVMFSTKGCAVVTPSTFPNQRSVVMGTNPPPRRAAP
jgi:hypothetical protein